MMTAISTQAYVVLSKCGLQTEQVVIALGVGWVGDLLKSSTKSSLIKCSLRKGED